MPTHAPRMNVWPTLAWWGRVVGFILLFLGTLIAVAFGSIPGGCFTQPTSCGTNFAAGVANALLVGKILWTIGLFFIGAGSAIRMHYTLQATSSQRAEEVVRGTHDRWMNALILIVTVVLLLWLLASVSLGGTLAGIP